MDKKNYLYGLLAASYVYLAAYKVHKLKEAH